jgi:hypothetical protein
MQSLEALPSETIQLDLRRYRHVRFPTGRFLQLASAIIVSLAFCTAQTATDKQMEPDSIGAFYYVDSSTNTLKLLPQEQFQRHTGGFGSITQSIRVSGSTSPFHFAASDQTAFLFKVFKDEAAAKAKLFQFNVKGSEREYPLGTWKRRDFTPNVGLPVNISKFGTSFKLSPVNPLAPGEYALTLGPTVYTFGVNASLAAPR